ncbi:MAG: hypothetical protein ACKOGA_13610 [Planctomycetaceae bacterium]
MTKNGLFAVSLIGAIPGAFLAYLCVMAFLNFAGGSSLLLKGLTGLLLLIGAGMPILSAATLLQGRGSKGTGDAPAEQAKGKSKAAVEVEEAEEAVALADSDELLDADEAVDDELVDDVFDEDEPPAKSKKKRK